MEAVSVYEKTLGRTSSREREENDLIDQLL